MFDERPTYYRLKQGINFYFPNPKGEALDIHFELRDWNMFSEGPAPVLVKLYDPNDETAQMFEIPDDDITSGGYANVYSGWEHELWYHVTLWDRGVKGTFRSDAFSDPKKLDALRCTTHKVSVPAGKPGVWQLMIVGGDDQWVKLWLSKPMKHGVLGHPDWLYCTGEELKTAYLYVPRTSKALDVWLEEIDYPRRRVVTVSDQSGKELVRLQAHASFASAKIEFDGREQVLRIDVSPGGDYALRLVGLNLPGILCPDPQTARAIRGSTIEAPDGTVFHHKIQLDMWKYLMQFRPGELRVESGKMALDKVDSNRAEIMIYGGRADPQSAVDNLYLGIGMINKVIDELKDPRDMAELIRSVAPMSRLHPAHDQFRNGMIHYYTHPYRGNPYYKDPALFKAIMFMIMKPFFEIREGDVVHYPTWINMGYSQGFGWECWAQTYYMKENLPPRETGLLKKAQGRLAERMGYARLPELVLTNGRTTIPLHLFYTALFTDDPEHMRLAERQLEWILDAVQGDQTGFSKAGHFREHFAVDYFYNTVALFQMGKLHRLIRNPKLREALSRCWDFQQHIALPEPGGKNWVSGTEFSARKSGYASGEFAGNAFFYFAEEHPMAATALRKNFGRRYYDHCKSQPVWQEGAAPPVRKPDVEFYLAWKDLKTGPLAAESEGSFMRNLGGADEFFCIKRPSYYTVIYGGKLAPFWNSEIFTGLLGFGGGGISSLWVPGYGAVLTGRVNQEYGQPIEQWREFRINSMSGEFVNGQPFLTALSNPVAEMDEKAGTLRFYGEVPATQFAFTRGYKFDDDRVRVSVHLSDLKRFELVSFSHARPEFPERRVADLRETLPFVVKGDVTLFDAEGKPLGGSRIKPTPGVRSVRFANRRGGAVILFDSPVSVGHSRTVLTDFPPRVRTLFAEPENKVVHEGDGVRLGYQIVPLNGPSDDSAISRLLEP